MDSHAVTTSECLDEWKLKGTIVLQLQDDDGEDDFYSVSGKQRKYFVRIRYLRGESCACRVGKRNYTLVDCIFSDSKLITSFAGNIVSVHPAFAYELGEYVRSFMDDPHIMFWRYRRMKLSWSWLRTYHFGVAIPDKMYLSMRPTYSDIDKRLSKHYEDFLAKHKRTESKRRKAEKGRRAHATTTTSDDRIATVSDVIGSLDGLPHQIKQWLYRDPSC